MSTQTSHNDASVGAYFELLPPRNLGRGSAKKTTGDIGVIAWNGDHVTDNGANVFPLTEEPFFLDVAYDQLDRPQVSWSTASGESFIYFYNGLISGYQTLSISSLAFEPAVCNDYSLEGGVNSVLAYLKNGIPTYRLQSDRFTVEYTLVNRKARGIKAFGYGKNTNSIQIIVGLWR